MDFRRADNLLTQHFQLMFNTFKGTALILEVKGGGGLSYHSSANLQYEIRIPQKIYNRATITEMITTKFT